MPSSRGRVSTTKVGLALCFALALLLAGAAPTALASNASIVTDPVEGVETLTITGGAEANGFEIDKSGGSYRIRDRIPNGTYPNTHNPITPGTGCAPEPFSQPGVICSPSSTLWDNIVIEVHAGAGNDFVSLASGIGSGDYAAWAVQAWLGTGNDDFVDQDASMQDSVSGEDGDDAVSSLGGNDYIDGGPGGDDHTRLQPSSNGDFGLAGGAGDDYIYGGPGNDVVDGEGGDDTVAGDGGDDAVSGGDGLDSIYGDDEDDQTTGNDVLEGETFGLYSGGGADVYFGGAGNDVLHAADGYSQTPVSGDEFNGGSGIDTVDYSQRNRGQNDDVSVSLDGLPNDGLAGPSGSIEGDNVGPQGDVENVKSTYAGTNVIIGDDGSNVLSSGGYSDNEFDAAAGNDRIVGANGQDTGIGGPGNDVITLGLGNDVAYAADGGTRDDVDCGFGDDEAFVDGADVFTGCEAIYTSGATTPAAGGTTPPPAGGTTPSLPAAITLPSLTAPTKLGLVLVSPTGVFFFPGLTVTCPPANGVPCTGSVTVSTAGAVSARAAASRKHKLVLAKGSLRVTAGSSKRIKVRLTAKGKRALRRLKRARAVATIRVVNRAGSSVTMRKRLTLKLKRGR
jgi:Ca2+-binding RTX toxin-like protein